VASRSVGEINKPSSLVPDGVGVGSGSTSARKVAHDPKDFYWRVCLVDDPETATAFVTRDRCIVVFTGILPFCYNEEGLAALLAHGTLWLDIIDASR
jgi:Peptidase family M48